MSDVETSDTAVSSAQLDADSLEFTVNTNLPLPATKASPGGAAPSLQELIEAELSVRLLQPDSLEPPASPTLNSLLSCDSIQPVSALTGPPLSLDSLTGLHKDPHGQTDVESGIDMLSPTKLDDLSNPDSLESSSDLPGSPGRYYPEPAVGEEEEEEQVPAASNGPLLLQVEDFSPPVNDLLIVEEGDLMVTHSEPESSSTPLMERHLSPPAPVAATSLPVQGDEAGRDNVTDGETDPPLFRITEPEFLSDETSSHSLSRSEEQLGLSESSSRTPDFSTSDGAATQEDPSSHNTTDEGREADRWRGSSSYTSGDSLNSLSVAESKGVSGTTTEASQVLSGHTEGTSSELLSVELSSSQGPFSSQELSSSPLSLSPLVPPSHTILPSGALPSSDTNRVCGDVSSNAGDDDSGGEVASATASSGDSREDITPSSDPNMEVHRLDDEVDDFWGNKEDDDEVPLHSYMTKNNEEEEEEEGEEALQSTRMTGNDDGEVVAEEEEEGEGPQGSNHFGGVDEDVAPAEGEEFVERGGKATQNGVRATTTEKKKKKKKRTEEGEKKSEDGEKKTKKKKKKKRGDSEKENKEVTTSSSQSDLDSEEFVPAPTPPLFNGHAITNGLSHCSKEDTLIKDDTLSDKELHSDHETFTKEDFHNLVDAYNREDSPKKEVHSQAPLSDEDDLAGVSVKQLRVSYLNAAQEKSQQHTDNYKSDLRPNIKADLNTSVNISSLVGTYSSPQPRAPTPSSRPDDLAPISLRSLKSVYEATATSTSGAVSRNSSSGSSSPAGGCPAPKEELNISLQQLREEYCRSVQDGHARSSTPSRTPPETGVSIRQLKAAYQYRDDLLEKHVGPRVRSFDASKMKSKFEKPKQVTQVPSECRQCGKQVFQMEKIVAEKASWHKNCFRCKECNTILTLETYQSHEGVLYCKPHFKDLFRPKAVIEDPAEARKERSTNKPDYGLEELSNTNLKQKFAMFELISTEEEQTPEPIPVRRSHSLLNRAARFMQSEDDEYGVENSELGEYDEDDEEDEEEEEEEDEEEDPNKAKKKGRPTSFSGVQDLKAGWAQKKRRDEMTRQRREELAKFRQMLCAGKNISTREMFESGNFEDTEKSQKRKEPINIEGRPAAKNLRERFEKGLSFQEDEEGRDDEHREVDHVFREAETANKARNLFKQIDSAVQEGNEPVLRVRSSAQARRENRLSRDGVDVGEQELGRDPNLIRCTDNYQDEVDCRSTRNVLAMFRKMEMQTEEDDRGPRPLKRFTPPPEGEDDDSDEDEYSDEEYSDEDEEDDSEDDEEEEDEFERKPKYKDEVLEMVKSSQSAKKAASLRAKFEKWESEVERNNEYNRSDRPEDEEECMPSIDTARNLRAMFENKAQEASRPVAERPKIKVNRFV